MNAYGYGGAGVDMYERAEVEREFAKQVQERRSGRLPFWDDQRAIEEMWEFCSSFPRGTSTFSAAAWAQSYINRGQLPPPNLRAALIKAALEAGWRIGYTSAWDVDLHAEFRA